MTIYIIMGVAGSGKSTVGLKIAEVLGCHFIEGDNYHPPENIERMSKGIPLNSENRMRWLQNLINVMTQCDQCVLSCSALKKSYRRLLRIRDNVVFIYLKGSYDLIRKRLEHRGGHFFNPVLLKSQFSDLEEPDESENDVIVVEIDHKNIDQISQEVSDLIKFFRHA